MSAVKPPHLKLVNWPRLFNVLGVTVHDGGGRVIGNVVTLSWGAQLLSSVEHGAFTQFLPEPGTEPEP